MFRWQSFHLLPQTNLLQRVRSMHCSNCVFMWSEQCLPLSGFNDQDENPAVSLRVFSNDLQLHNTNNTNHTVFIKSSRKFSASATSLTLILFLLSSSGQLVGCLLEFQRFFDLTCRDFRVSLFPSSQPAFFFLQQRDAQHQYAIHSRRSSYHFKVKHFCFLPR